MGDGCPTDETLAAHVAGALDDVQADALRDHLDDCALCRELLVVLARGTPAGQKLELATTIVAIGKLRNAAPAALPPRFKIEHVLGQGGMGRVYAARDTELDRRVAVKVMRHEVGDDALAARLVRESRLMARLSHPGVVTIYDVGRHAGHIFIAMELVDGLTLHGWIRQRRRPWRAIVDVFVRAGAGLAAAHAAGLVHRDIKPENILLALDGDRVTRVAVSDFGVARAASETTAEDGVRRRSDRDVALTTTGAAVGTPAYMAPEQLAGRSVDVRADVFSFGVSLWEALWGERPYRGGSIAELVAKLEAGAPEIPARPTDAGAETTPPGWLARAVREAIEPDPARRTPSITALLGAIDPAQRARRRTFGLVAGGIVAAAAGVAIAIVAQPASAAELPALCGDAGLAATWNDASRLRLRTAVLASSAEAGGGIADRAVRAVDSYAEQWTTTRATSCMLDEPRRRDAAAACLDADRHALATVLDNVRDMRRGDVATLDDTAGALPSPSLCGTDAAVAVMRDVPPIMRGSVAAVEGKIMEALALATTGQQDRARRALVELAPIVAATGSRALEAVRLAAFAQALPDRDVDGQLAANRAAAIASSTAGRDDLAALAWLQVARIYTDTKNDAGRAGDALALADAAITRGGDDARLRIQYQVERAQLATFSSKYADAAKILEGLRERAERDVPELVPIVERTAISLAIEGGKASDAVPRARALIAELGRRNGPTHKSAIGGYELLGNAQLVAGDPAGALASAKTAVELTKRGYGADSDAYGLALRNLATSYDALGKLDDAIATVRAARDVLVATRGPRSFMVGETYLTEAIAMRDGHMAASLPIFEQALAIFRDSVGDQNAASAEAIMAYAETLAQLGRGDQAVAAERKAVEIVRAVYGEDSPRYAYARAGLGEALIHAHDKRAARVELEAAVAIYGHTDFDPALKAAATFNLAETLVDDPAQHDRALALGKQALAFFETAGPEWRDAVTHMKQWVAQDGKGVE
ncbi:MAG TPA: serine/threonine-protein kinase [Kofleriaceae bacterium]